MHRLLSVMESSDPSCASICRDHERLDDVAAVRGTKETAEAGTSLEEWPEPFSWSWS